MKTATAYSLSLAHWALNEYPPTADNLGNTGRSCLIVHCTCNVSLLTGIEMTSLSDSRTSRQYRVASRSDFWYQQKDDLVALWQMPSTSCRQLYSKKLKYLTDLLKTLTGPVKDLEPNTKCWHCKILKHELHLCTPHHFTVCRSAVGQHVCMTGRLCTCNMTCDAARAGDTRERDWYPHDMREPGRD